MRRDAGIKRRFFRVLQSQKCLWRSQNMTASSPSTQTPTESTVNAGKHCIECGYALQVLHEPRCPECGRRFNPADPATMITARRGVRLARRFLRPPRFGSFFLVSVAAAGSLCGASAPGWYLPLLGWSMLLWLIVGLVWLVRVMLLGWASEHLGQIQAPEQLKRAWARSFAWVAGLFVTVCIAIMFSLPMKAAYWLSRPAMDRWAKQFMTAPEGTRAPECWIGLYPAYRINRELRGVRFDVDGAGIEDPFSAGRPGYMYAPDYDLGPYSDQEYEPMGGGWYRTP